MTKEDAAMKKAEAKEEGTATKHLRVVYSDKRGRNCSLLAAVLFTICVCAIISVYVLVYNAIKPRIPHFTLEDLYVDPISNSTLVRLSSTNPSKSSVYYSKIGVHVWVLGDFETEKVFLDSTLQRPRQNATWTAVVATNSNSDNPNGTFQIRNGAAPPDQEKRNGDVIADLSIQRKRGFFSLFKYGVRVTCPVSLRLQDLASAIPNPMSKCSQHFS